MENNAKVERTSVNVVIDVDELEEMKSLTSVDANATAIVAAARIGIKFLKKVNIATETALLNSNLVNLEEDESEDIKNV